MSSLPTPSFATTDSQRLAMAKDFIWGAASSAYQIEGAPDIDGKGESIWDRFVAIPGKIANGDTGNIACKSYFKLEEDVRLLSELGVDSYRFSISWPRILPDGKGPENIKGLDYYKRLCAGLVKAGIKPVPTLFHWDSPQKLEEIGGWGNRDMAKYFSDYALLVARHLIDYTDQFILLNEPTVFAHSGYCNGVFAPGYQNDELFYSVIHHLNLAHGIGLNALKSTHSNIQVGSAYTHDPVRPLSNKAEDIEAANLFREYWQDCFLGCATFGQYPDLWQKRIEPYVQDNDFDIISAKQDFIGINHYRSIYCKFDPKESLGVLTTGRSVHDVEVTDFDWEVSPEAFYETLTEMKEKYHNPVVLITESGACYDDPFKDDMVCDDRRIAYLDRYIATVQKAIENGVNIKGYYVWSLLDNFEWSWGYAKRFGIVYVDFKNDCRRVPKKSYGWLKQLFANNKSQPTPPAASF